MLNVGDIKPAEVSIDLFMQMGWDISRWQRNNLGDFLEEWAASKFDARHAPEIAAILDQYYRLGFARKPEHLQWNFANEDRKPTALTAFDYGDEVQQRIDAYDALLARADRLYAETPPALKDALYELVVYPVRASALANRRYFSFEKAREYMAQGRASASEWTRKGEEATRLLDLETRYFNEKLANGKWRHMMSEVPPGDMWQYMRMRTPVAPALQELKLSDKPALGVAIEGRREPLNDNEVAALPAINGLTRGTRFIDVFNTGTSVATWKATTSQRWIKLSQIEGDLRHDTRVFVSIDWARTPKDEKLSGTVEVSGAGVRRVITVPVFNPKANVDPGSFVETNGVVSIEAEHFAQFPTSTKRPAVSWSVIPGLGRTSDAVSVSPTSAGSVNVENISTAPVMNYPVYLFTTGKLSITCYLTPTFPITTGQGLRYAIAFDNQPPQIITVGADLQTPSRQWSLNVLNASTTGASTHEIATAGAHTLKIYMVDAGVVLDKIVIDTGGLRPSYLGPPETRYVKR